MRWKQAYGRFFSKLGGRPVIQRNVGKQSVWLTSEVFEFVPVADTATGEVSGYTLDVGTRKHPAGRLSFKAHKLDRIPASIHPYQYSCGPLVGVVQLRRWRAGADRPGNHRLAHAVRRG
ncbi:MAG: hypothetical protein ACYC9L_14135 [Sulfuricaulis sp.]